MKKVFLSFALLMASAVSVVNAQSSQIHIGGAFPAGKFGQGKEQTQTPYDNGVGFAATGLNAGYKFYTPVADKLSLLFGIDIFYNGLNADYKEELEDNQYPDADVTFPAYINIPVTAGLNYTYPLNNKFSIYGEGFVGLNYASATTFKAEDENEETTRTFESAFTFTYGLEGGITINNKYTIGLRYISLGSHKFKMTTKTDYGSGNVDKTERKFKKALPISNIALTVGYKF